MKRKKNSYMTAKEMRQILINGEDMPTAIFDSKKEEYIVKPRGTIFGLAKKRTR